MIPALVLLAPLVTPPAPPPQDAAVPAAEESVLETAEDIEIMRRVLVKALSEREGNRSLLSPAEVPTVFGLYSHQNAELLSAGTGVTHSRGFHVPGEGALFTLDVQVPVRRARQAEEAETSDADDAWNAARNELHGRGRGPGAWVDVLRKESGRVRVELDPEHVARVRETVLETLARHASRIRGLSRMDHVTVAIHLQGGMSIARADEGDEDETAFWNVVSTATWHAAPERNLVIRLPMENLAGFIDDRGDVRKGGTVHEY